MHSEEESLSGQRLSRYHGWRSAEINWVLKSESLIYIYIYIYISNSPYITTCCSNGFQEKKSPGSSKNKLQYIQLSDTTGTSNPPGFYGKMKLSGFTTGIKSTPCPRLNILMDFLCCGLFLLEILYIFFRNMAFMDSIKYQQIKNLNLTVSVRNLIMGRVWIFRQDHDPQRTS